MRTAERALRLTAIVMLGTISILASLPAGQVEAAAPTEEHITPTPHSGAEADVEAVKVLLPDLVTLPPEHLRLIWDPETDRRRLRFSNTIANIGEGPLELRGAATGVPGRYRVNQRLYGSNDEVLLEPIVDEIIFHRDHNHWHLEAFASYEVWRTTPDGRMLEPVEVRGKISYCVYDRRPLDAEQRGAEYTGCSPELQGMTVGWTDTYTFSLAGQWVDLTTLPDGFYALRSVVNPRGELRELLMDNNEALLGFMLTGIQVQEVPLAKDPWTLAAPGRDGQRSR